MLASRADGESGGHSCCCTRSARRTSWRLRGDHCRPAPAHTQNQAASSTNIASSSNFSSNPISNDGLKSTATTNSPLQAALLQLLAMQDATDQRALGVGLEELCTALEASAPLAGASVRKPPPLIHRSGREILRLRAQHAAALSAAAATDPCAPGSSAQQPFAHLYASTASADAHAPLEERLLGARVPRIACDDDEARPPASGGASSRLHPEAARLLGQQMAFVMTGHGLWPSAERRWGERAFLEAELAGVGGCAVLAAPLASRTFLYWMPPRRFASLADAMGRGHDRVLAPYDFDEPSVEQLNLGAAEFFALSEDGSKDERARGKAFYLQHCVVKPGKPPSPPTAAAAASSASAAAAASSASAAASASSASAATAASSKNGPMTLGADGCEMRPTAGLGACMCEDIDHGIDRPLLEAMQRAGRLGPWISTVLFVGGRSAAGARTRLHFDQVDNVYLQVRGYSLWILFQPAFAPSPLIALDLPPQSSMMSREGPNF
jgi:hypothetical protein